MLLHSIGQVRLRLHWLHVVGHGLHVVGHGQHVCVPLMRHRRRSVHDPAAAGAEDNSLAHFFLIRGVLILSPPMLLEPLRQH